MIQPGLTCSDQSNSPNLKYLNLTWTDLREIDETGPNLK